MKIDVFKKRIVRRLSMPPEVLFALSRHWLVIFLFVALGAAILSGLALVETPVYLGKATLMFANEPLVVGHGRQDGRQEAERSLNAYVQILESDSVLRSLVADVQPANVLAQEEPPRTEAKDGLRKLLAETTEAAKRTIEALLLQDPDDASEEFQTQKAMEAFRKRSEVVPSALTNTVEIRVEGGNRDIVARELDAWVKSFVAHLTEMAGESRDSFVSSRKSYWGELEKKAREAAEAFKKENPDASKANQDLILQEVTQLQVLRIDLQRRLETGRGQEAPIEGGLVDQPDKEGLLAQRRALLGELIQVLPLHPLRSDRVQTLQKSLELVESRLKAAKPEKVPSSLLQDQLQKVGNAIAEAMKRHSMIGAKLERLEILEEELKRYEQTRKSYELLDMERQDREELSRSAQVQVSDKPKVSWLPRHASLVKYGSLGGLAGLAFSVSLVLFFEALAGKVRFKNDVLGEFGLPVVAVIPRK